MSEWEWYGVINIIVLRVGVAFTGTQSHCMLQKLLFASFFSVFNFDWLMDGWMDDDMMVHSISFPFTLYGSQLNAFFLLHHHMLLYFNYNNILILIYYTYQSTFFYQSRLKIKYMSCNFGFIYQVILSW